MHKNIHSLCQRNNFIELQNALIENPDQIDKTDCFGRSLLTWSVLKENKEWSAFVIERCPSLRTALDKTARSPLHYAARNKEGIDMCRTLILSPLVLSRNCAAAFYDINNRALTTLLIYKYCRNQNKTLCTLPRRLLVAMLQSMLLQENSIKIHKEQVFKMLSLGNEKAFTCVSKNNPHLSSLLDPQNIIQWDKEIESIYKFNLQ